MINIDDPKILSAIAAVISGANTDEEKELVDGWLLEDEKNNDILEALKNIGYDHSLEQANQSKEKIYSMVQEKTQKHLLKRKLRIWQYISVASVVALLILGGINLLMPSKSSPDYTTYVETKCVYGTKSRIVLSDSTVVELNSGSVLKYPTSFGGQQREVILSGEAYFDVAKVKGQSFIVKTKNIDVKVLGTQFNVKAYEEDNNIITTLIEGSVSVETTTSPAIHDPIILSPNQQLIFDRTLQSTHIQQVDASMFVGWVDGKYYFEKESFSEIARKLERGFNVQIVINSSKLKNELFSGVFDKGENIQQILDLFKRYRYFDYKQIGNTIEIYEK